MYVLDVFVLDLGFWTCRQLRILTYINEHHIHICKAVLGKGHVWACFKGVKRYRRGRKNIFMSEK